MSELTEKEVEFIQNEIGEFDDDKKSSKKLDSYIVCSQGRRDLTEVKIKRVRHKFYSNKIIELYVGICPVCKTLYWYRKENN